MYNLLLIAQGSTFTVVHFFLLNVSVRNKSPSICGQGLKLLVAT